MPLEMNPEIRAQWCAALRSGEYKQGRECLHREDDEFCCLGVLTDLAAQAGVIEWDNTLAAELYLPDPVRVWAGLGSDNPKLFSAESGAEEAASRNDSGDTFAEIADLIDGGEVA